MEVNQRFSAYPFVFLAFREPDRPIAVIVESRRHNGFGLSMTLPASPTGSHSDFGNSISTSIASIPRPLAAPSHQ
jgi:hypothetical protein